MVQQRIEKQNKQNTHVLAWLIWSIVALFYFYEICLRMLPGIITKQTMLHFHIDATQLGMFTALYYWSYTLMQIPAGLLVDRFNIQSILCLASLTCVTGFSMVHHTHSFTIAEIGRFIIGAGSAFAYVSCLKVASLWLPKQRFGLASCLLDSIGMLGALFTTLCLVQINLHFSDRVTVWLLTLSGLVITGLMAACLRDAKRFIKVSRRKKNRKTISITEALQTAAKSKNLWLLGLIGCLSYLPSSVIGDVWGLPYLQTTYHFDKTHASWILGAFFAAWAIAGPAIGIVSDRLQSRIKPVMCGLVALFITLSVIVYVPLLVNHGLPFLFTLCLFVFMGMAVATHPLIFAMAKEEFSNHMAGTIVACTNMIIMLGGLFFQPLIGFLIDLHRNTHMHSVIYSASDYARAFSIIPACILTAILALIVVVSQKEKTAAPSRCIESNVKKALGSSFSDALHL